MAARLQLTEWLEGEPVGELATLTPRDTLRPALEPSLSTSRGLHRTGPRLVSARQLVESQRREDRLPPLPTTLPELDRLLAGGLARGRLIELVGARSSGRFSLVLAALAAATESGEVVALIDLDSGLDPERAAGAGIDLARLLWVRPRRVAEALAGADMLMTTGFPLVVVDLGTPPVPGGRGAQGSWLRLARTARQRRTALLVSSPYRVSGPAAETIVVARARTRASSGDREALPLFLGLDVELRLEKARGKAPGAVETLALQVGEAPRAPADRPPETPHGARDDDRGRAREPVGLALAV